MQFKLARRIFQRTNGTLVASVVAALCFFAGVAITTQIGQIVLRDMVLQEKREAVAALSEIRARLEGELTRLVAHGLGIRSYVAQFDDKPFDPANFSEIAIDLVEENPSVRSIGLAPDNVLRAVYPNKPNQAALGLDYRRNLAQWPSVLKAMETREVVIAGPTDLLQGGRALLVRIPVFPPAFPGQPVPDRSYWGVATLVLDEDAMLVAAGVMEVVNGLQISVIDQNSANETEDTIFGNDELRTADNVSLPLHLPGGLQWEMLGYPLTGWARAGNDAWLTQLAGGLISLVFGAMAFLLVSEVYKVRSMALQDPLTGLANRRLLEDRMLQLVAQCDRNGVGFEIFYVDLDAFKPVNDRFGHTVGDQLLIEIGRRLQGQVRQTDTVARIGGDEFIVLTTGNMRRNEKKTFQERLSEKVAEGFEFSGASVDVSASFGSASYPADALTMDDLLKVADGRMYAEKEQSKRSPTSGLQSTELPQAG